MNNPTPHRKSFLQRFYWIFAVAFAVLLVWCIIDPTLVDVWKSIGYTPTTEVTELRKDLELTQRGERVFAATHLVLEDSAAFNEHCDSHNEEVALLGCYVEGKIYIYNITEAQLQTANQVTAAHELLHAVWERLGTVEKKEIADLLEQVYQEHQTWFDEELEYYDETDHIEEIYTRAATKLSDLPAELEQHYAKYLANRAKIVAYYQAYEAPFLHLQLELQELLSKIRSTSDQIEEDRQIYLADLTALNLEIEQFNSCAGAANCFTSQSEFSARRAAILARQSELEVRRAQINRAITENNNRIQDYRARQQVLGRLNAAMNSNVEIIDVIE